MTMTIVDFESTNVRDRNKEIIIDSFIKWS